MQLLKIFLQHLQSGCVDLNCALLLLYIGFILVLMTKKTRKKIMEFFLALTQKENFHFTSLVWTYIIKVPFTVKNPKLCKMGLRVLKCPKKLTCLTQMHIAKITTFSKNAIVKKLFLNFEKLCILAVQTTTVHHYFCKLNLFRVNDHKRETGT